MTKYPLMYILINYLLTHNTKSYLDLIQGGDKCQKHLFPYISWLGIICLQYILALKRKQWSFLEVTELVLKIWWVWFMIKIGLASFSGIFFYMYRHGLSPLEILLYVDRGTMFNWTKTINNSLRSSLSRKYLFLESCLFCMKSKQPVFFTQDTLT